MPGTPLSAIRGVGAAGGSSVSFTPRTNMRAEAKDDGGSFSPSMSGMSTPGKLSLWGEQQHATPKSGPSTAEPRPSHGGNFRVEGEERY